jgi:hypothetical protein
METSGFSLANLTFRHSRGKVTQLVTQFEREYHQEFIGVVLELNCSITEVSFITAMAEERNMMIYFVR